MKLPIKTLFATALAAGTFVAGLSVNSTTVRADNDNNGAQDYKRMVDIGLSVAPVKLKYNPKDQEMVGLGSYMVNVASDCNGCHTLNAQVEFLPQGNPYLLPPVYQGKKLVNTAHYLGGGNPFGVFPGGASIVSRNLTPDYTGRAVGGMTLAEFTHVIRTGIDKDLAHPNCPSNPSNCLAFPFDGTKLQVMPWSQYQDMTDRQITAMYTYLSSIPCLEGGPGEPAGRCVAH